METAIPAMLKQCQSTVINSSKEILDPNPESFRILILNNLGSASSISLSHVVSCCIDIHEQARARLTKTQPSMCIQVHANNTNSQSYWLLGKSYCIIFINCSEYSIIKIADHYDIHICVYKLLDSWICKKLKFIDQ